MQMLLLYNRHSNHLLMQRNLTAQVLKKRRILDPVEDADIDKDNHHIFMNFCVIKCIVQTVGKCPECNNNSDLEIINDVECKLGFANKLLISCTACDWTKIMFTSLPVKKETSSTRGGYGRFDINTRTVFAFREIGQGYQSIQDFAINMNMMPPNNLKAYHSINEILHDAYENAAEFSMNNHSHKKRNSPGNTGRVF